MGEIGRWHGHKFEVKPELIRSFTGLQIKAAIEIDEKEGGGEKYVSRKNAKPMELSLTVGLNAMVGCDVRKEAIKFLSDAQAGESGYFYIGSKKLASFQMMLTEASVDEVELSGSGDWISANVALKMQQAGRKNGGGSGGSGPGDSYDIKRRAVEIAQEIARRIKEVAGVITRAKTKTITGGGTKPTMMTRD